MNAESRYARRFVFYAFLLLAAVYLHFFFLARAGNSGGWSRWVPGEEAVTVFFVSLELLALLGVMIAGARAWCMLLTVRGKASPFVREINRLGILQTAERRWGIRHFALASKLALGGLCILACTLSLLGSGTIDSAEWSIIPQGNVTPYAPEESASIIFSFSTPDENLREYLACVRRLAVDLGQAGAKVIVCAMPDTSAHVLQRPMVDTIARMKNVVIYDGRVQDPPRRTWVPVSAVQRERMPIVSSAAEGEEQGFDPIQLWYPYASYSTASYPSKEREARMDAAVAALGRYFNIAENVRPVLRGGSLVYANIVIPVTTSGLAYSRTVQSPPSDVVAIASRGNDGKLRIRYHHHPDWDASDGIPARYASQFEGKIVLLDWIHDEPFGYSYDRSLRSTRTMQTGIESMVHQSMLLSMEWLTVTLILVCIAMSVVVMTILPLRWSVALTFIVGMVVFASGVYALSSFQVLLRTGYGLAAATMCAVLLPYIRLFHERAEQNALK